MHTFAVSMTVNAGGQSARIPLLANTSAQSAASQGSIVLVTPDVNCFIRQGINPVAVVDSDQILLANSTYRIMVAQGQKLAFIAAAAGNVYVTQEV